MVAVEIDPECCRRLEALPAAPGRLQVVHGDILASHGLLPWQRAPLRLVGNLPYYLSSPILRWTLAQGGERVADAHYMLQREVAERLAAGPGSRRYGLLSVLARAAAEVEILRRLAPGAFRPPPEVESAFVRLRPRADARPLQGAELRPIEVAFAHRRKTLARALRYGGWHAHQIAQACSVAGVDPGERAERLDVAAWRRLAAALPEPRT